MKFVTGEKDADATDSTAFDDMDLGESDVAPAEAGRAPSSGTPFPDTAETKETPTRRAEPDTGKMTCHGKSGPG